MDINKCETLLQQADRDIKDNYIEQAIKTLNEIITANPKFGKAYNHLGFIYETKHQNYVEAEKNYKLALENSPEYRAVYYNYAILLSTLGRYDDLGKLLEKALKVPGINKATIYNEYAIMFETLEEYDKAIRHYQDSVRYSINNDAVNKASDSIERCKRKKEILSNNY